MSAPGTSGTAPAGTFAQPVGAPAHAGIPGAGIRIAGWFLLSSGRRWGYRIASWLLDRVDGEPRRDG
jgi:hypothetical protein